MATATITVGGDKAAAQRVRQALNQVAQFDPYWNGANFEVVQGVFTEIEYEGPQIAEALMSVIGEAIASGKPIADEYIGGRFTATPEDNFAADGVEVKVIADNGERTIYEFVDGSRCAVDSDGEIVSAK